MGKTASKPAASTAGENDPLLAAVISKLPAPGTSWPAEQRVAWLKMMAMAFDLAYGVVEEMPAFLGEDRSTSARPVPSEGSGEPKPLPVTGTEPDRFYVDAKGHARKDPGRIPITVNDVPTGEVIWDERPLGKRDLDTIVWADGEWPPGSLPPLNFAGG